MTPGKGPGPRLTLHVQLGLPAVALNEDGGAQEGGPAQGPHEGAEHEGELQGPELGQEGRGPAPAEAVGHLWGDEEESQQGHGEGSREREAQTPENEGGTWNLQGEDHSRPVETGINKILPA